jgi:hypothetical protein
MPGRAAPQVLVPVRKQHEIARNELGLQAAHMLQPWLAWLGVTFLGLVLRLGFVEIGHMMILGVALVLGLGVIVFVLDAHLRQHHDTIPGKLIGPVTIASVVLSLALFMMVGFWEPLSLIYFTGGIGLCACWDYWMRSAEHRDLARAFITAAEKSGVGGTRMLHLKRGARKSTATLKHEPGSVTTADVTGNVERIESALGHPPGSWTISPDPENAGYSKVSISDPAVLDAAPLPWPGPSHPGASIAEPVRGGLWQDAEEMTYKLVGSHLLGMGATNAGKTMSWTWNQMAEGITRCDYACLAADITKRDQFLGALRPALHVLAITPEQALDLLDAVHRIGDARADYMAAMHLTEWREGCGLTFLDIWLEECADIVALLDRKGLQRWKSDVRRLRSFGARWNLSTQRADFNEVPTLVRGQMGKMCFGVNDPKDAEFGLTAEQQQRGCRPQIWGTNYPGKCYIDALGIPEARRAMPMRWWSWGKDSIAIAAYAAQWPVSRRPLDDVTGEALEATPGPLASLAFPVPALPPPRRARDDGDDGDEDLDDMDDEGSLAPVRQLRPRQDPGPDPHPSMAAPVRLPPRPSQQQAEAMVRAQLTAWLAMRTPEHPRGKKFFIKHDWDPALGVLQRSSGWLYNTMFPNLVAEGTLAAHRDGRLTRWEILAGTDGDEGQ